MLSVESSGEVDLMKGSANSGVIQAPNATMKCTSCMYGGDFSFHISNMNTFPPVWWDEWFDYELTEKLIMIHFNLLID